MVKGQIFGNNYQLNSKGIKVLKIFRVFFKDFV